MPQIRHHWLTFASQNKMHVIIIIIIWRAVRNAQIYRLVRISLPQSYDRRSYRATLIPLPPCKPIAWDDTVPGSFALSQLQAMFLNAGAVIDNETKGKSNKERDLSSMQIFIPVVIETGGSWNTHSIELVQENCKRISLVNSEQLKNSISLSLYFHWHPEGMHWHSKTHFKKISLLSFTK